MSELLDVTPQPVSEPIPPCEPNPEPAPPKADDAAPEVAVEPSRESSMPSVIPQPEAEGNESLPPVLESDDKPSAMDAEAAPTNENEENEVAEDSASVSRKRLASESDSEPVQMPRLVRRKAMDGLPSAVDHALPLPEPPAVEEPVTSPIPV
jgi:hypothetical protein